MQQYWVWKQLHKVALILMCTIIIIIIKILILNNFYAHFRILLFCNRLQKILLTQIMLTFY